MYSRVDFEDAFGSDYEDDVLLVGSVFVGMNLNLDRMFIPVEWKYMFTENSGTFGSDLNFWTIMLGLGVRF
jgi:hypothetical protein